MRKEIAKCGFVVKKGGRARKTAEVGLVQAS